MIALRVRAMPPPRDGGIADLLMATAAFQVCDQRAFRHWQLLSSLLSLGFPAGLPAHLPFVLTVAAVPEACPVGTFSPLAVRTFNVS